MRWEKFFRCNDLAKDLPPVIEASALGFGFRVRCQLFENDMGVQKHRVHIYNPKMSQSISLLWEDRDSNFGSPHTLNPKP